MQATIKTLHTSTLQVMARTLEGRVQEYAADQASALYLDAVAQLAAISEELWAR